MRKDFKKGSVEWNIIFDFWNFWQKYAIAETRDIAADTTYWDDVVRDMNRLVDKYLDYDKDFIAMLFVNLVEHFERIAPMD